MWATENNGPSVHEMGQDAEKNKQEQQKIDIQKQEADTKQKEVQLQEQHQQTTNMMVIGGLAIGSVLVIVISIYLLSRVFKKK